MCPDGKMESHACVRLSGRKKSKAHVSEGERGKEGKREKGKKKEGREGEEGKEERKGD